MGVGIARKVAQGRLHPSGRALLAPDPAKVTTLPTHIGLLLPGGRGVQS